MSRLIRQIQDNTYACSWAILNGWTSTIKLLVMTLEIEM